VRYDVLQKVSIQVCAICAITFDNSKAREKYVECLASNAVTEAHAVLATIFFWRAKHIASSCVTYNRVLQLEKVKSILVSRSPCDGK
jgi:hypothetical protein